MPRPIAQVGFGVIRRNSRYLPENRSRRNCCGAVGIKADAVGKMKEIPVRGPRNGVGDAGGFQISFGFLGYITGGTVVSLLSMGS